MILSQYFHPVWMFMYQEDTFYAESFNMRVFEWMVKMSDDKHSKVIDDEFDSFYRKVTMDP